MTERHNFDEFILPLSLDNRHFRNPRRPPFVKVPRTQTERRQFMHDVLDAIENRIIPTVLSGNLIHPELIFRLPPAKEKISINQNELEKKYKFTILENSFDGNIVIFATEDDVNNFISDVREYGENFKEDDKYNPQETFGIPKNIINSERIGNSLRKNPLTDDFEDVDIYLWYFGNGTEIIRQTNKIMQDIVDKIRKLNGVITDTNIIVEYVIIKAKINSEILDVLIKEPCIRKIERSVIFSAQNPVQLIRDDPEFQFLEPSSDFGILVLDEAILPGNKFVSHAIQDYQLNPDISAYDSDHLSHGTAVSCFAIHGDLYDIVSTTKIFQPVGKLYFGSILDPNANTLVKIRDMLDYFLDHYPNIRIVNISMASDNVIDSKTWKQMPIANILDRYQFESALKGRDLIFVVSIGNFFFYSYGHVNQYYRNFNNFIQDIKENKIVDPASSALSITVGSICLGENIPKIFYNESSLCREFYPSPFSRVGPGVSKSVKPDFVEFGSDSIRLGAHSIDEQSPGILTINSKEYGPFTFDEGTSFAAPILTNKIARLWIDYPNLNSNSIKALLAIGSDFHENFREFFKISKNSFKSMSASDQKKILNTFGYGRVDLNKSQFSEKNWVVLLQERKLSLTNFDLFDIPIPNEFFESGGKKKISIAIAYNPLVKESRKDYLGVELDYIIFRNIPSDVINKYYEKIVKKALEDGTELDLDEQDQFDEDIDDEIADFEKMDDDYNYIDDDNENEDNKTNNNKTPPLSTEELLNLNLDNKKERSIFSTQLQRYKITNYYPPKKLLKRNCIKKHIIEFSRRIKPPNEYGYKILLYAKYSQTKWFETLELSKNFKQPYSIIVGLECQTDIGLRALVRTKLRTTIRQRINT